MTVVPEFAVLALKPLRQRPAREAGLQNEVLPTRAHWPAPPGTQHGVGEVLTGTVGPAIDYVFFKVYNYPLAT